MQHGLEPLFELPAELRARDHRGEVQRDEAAALQRLGDVALDDALGEALDDRGLADAGLADQHRVVLGAPREDLDDAADLLVAPDDRVEAALARERGQVAAVLFERLERRLGVLGGDARRAAHVAQRGEQRLGRRAERSRRTPSRTWSTDR